MESITVREIVESTGGKLLCGHEKTIIKRVCIDSRDEMEDALFVPIIGERVDAHKFIGQVLEDGAAAVLTSHGEIIDESRAHILVENTEQAMGDLSAYYRRKFRLPVIGITGSVGKTSTKEMIAAALETRFKVLKTAGNQNSNIGVPLTLFRIEAEHEIAVVEMGISHFGEMDELAKFANPHTAVVTNIGVAHIAQLLSKENIMTEKLKAAKFFGEENFLYLNGDDPLLSQTAQTSDYQVLFYGSGPHCDFYSKDIYIEDGRQHFTYVHPGGEEKVVLAQVGQHNVSNAVIALTIAQQYGIAPAIAKSGIQAYKGMPMRQQINHLPRGIKVIDDTYNASPDSIISGIDVLKSLDNSGRKIAVLGDVKELGELSLQIHYDAGVRVARTGIDQVVTVGEEMKHLAQAIGQTAPEITVVSFDSNESANTFLEKDIRDNDALLVKGSRGMHMEDIVNHLKEVLV